MKRILCCLMTCFFVTTIFACPYPQYQVIDLGFQESERSEAIAINDTQQVVGAFWIAGKKHFFLWDPLNGTKLLDVPQTAQIVKINNLGQIVGNYTDAANHECGFLWDAVSGCIDIKSSEGESSVVFDMNDLGQVVGEFVTNYISLVDDKPEIHAFVWQEGVLTDLGTLSGSMGLVGDRSCAVGINNSGQIIGSSNYPIVRKGKLHRSRSKAVIWRNGIVEEIDPQFNGASKGLSINDEGLIVYHKRDRKNCGDYLFNLNENSSIKIKNGNNSFGKINNQGAILYFPANIRHAHQYRTSYANELMIKMKPQYLELSLQSLFLDIAQNLWQPEGFIGAYDFNNHNWIVGVARNIDGETHAILMTPVY